MPKTPTIERAADLLLRAQLAALPGDGQGVLLEEVRGEWNREAEPGEEVSKSTLRRVVRHLIKVAGREGFERLGALSRPHVPAEPGRAGRPAWPRLLWTPARPLIRRVKVQTRGPEIENVVLSQAFMGEVASAPFERAAEGVFTNVFGPLANSLGPGDAARLEELRTRGFWYQPAVHRRLDPDVVNECITAVLHRNQLQIDEYRSPNREGNARAYTFEPWTLVQSYDGLYVLGQPAGSPTKTRGRLLAVHRMGVAHRLRKTKFELPHDFDPEKYLGHGFGPYVGQPGRTLLFVPDDEWRFVEEMLIPSEKARRQVPGGWELELGTGFNHGLRLWCRWQGIRILESDGMPAWVRDLQK